MSTGDPEMVYTVLQHRDYHNTSMALEGVPELLQKILEVSVKMWLGHNLSYMLIQLLETQFDILCAFPKSFLNSEYEILTTNHIIPCPSNLWKYEVFHKLHC